MDTSPEEKTGVNTTDASPDSEPVFAQTSAVSDQATSRDSLGFKLYVEALANFLLAPATCAPFTVSIEGTWGTGKSSFMLQLKERIKTQSGRAITIDFNAWKYDKQEELWAAFALTVSRSLRRDTRFPRRLLCDIGLYRSRLKGLREKTKLIAKLALWLVLLSVFAYSFFWSFRAPYPERHAAVQKVVDDTLPSKPASTPNPPLTAPPKADVSGTGPNTRSSAVSDTGPSRASDGARTSLTKEWLLFGIANSHWATGLILLIWLVMKFRSLSGKTLFEIELEQYIDRPDYKGKAAFVDAFSEDFGKSVRAYAPRNGAKIFVFIDDLDRCEVPKAADLMQAINLMIGDGSPLFFIIGLDRGKVAASIAFKYRGIAPYLLSPSEFAPGASIRRRPDYAKIRAFGDEFLEKFIQISFPIPVSDNDEQAKEFINSLISPSVVLVHRSNWLRRLVPWLVKNGQSLPTGATPPALRESGRNPFRIESGPESERIRSVLLMVREILGHNPRRIKTFLNRFRLMLYIASSQGLLDKDLKTGIAEVTPEQLGKFIALVSAYPDMLAESVADPSFFQKLEFYLTWGKTGMQKNIADADKNYVERWLRPGVRALVTPPKTLTAAWANTYSLERFPVSKFVQILPPVPAPPKRLSRIQVQFSSPEDETATARLISIPGNHDVSVPRPGAPRFTAEISQLKPTPSSINFQQSEDTLATSINFQHSADNFPTSRNFQQSADALPDSHKTESENIESFTVIRQAPDQGSKDALPSARSAGAGIRFSEPVDSMDALPPARTAGVVNRFSEPVEVEKKQIDERDDRGMEEVAAPLDKDPDPETDGVGGASPFVPATGAVIKQIV
jgi:hypothetical protein